MGGIPARELGRFDVSRERGYLPVPDPLRRLPARFDPWEEVAQEFPKLLASRGAYAELLRGPDGRSEIPSLLDAVTVNYTFFFREAAQFQTLAAAVFPRLLAGRAERDGEPLRIWSAGCSSGEEPYSVAITLAEVVGSPERCAARILATDINRRVLRTGQRGIYPEDRFTHMP